MLILSESSQYLALKGHIEDAYKSPAWFTSIKIEDRLVDVGIKELITNTESMKV
jgi:hypothetical protein